MDCQMPEMHGFEATAAIRGLDGPRAETHRQRAEGGSGAVPRGLAKPLDRTALRLALQRWL